MRDELRGQIMTEFFVVGPTRYSYLMNDGNNGNKAKETKNV